MITQKRLKEVLRYDRYTGIFFWLSSAGTVKAGDIAGSVSEQGYIRIGVDGKLIRAHRLAWLYVHGYMPSMIDHKDQVRHHNWIENLREVTSRESNRNRSNNTKCPGVSWDKSRSKWTARIKGNSKYLTLSRTSDYFEACCTRKAAELAYG